MSTERYGSSSLEATWRGTNVLNIQQNGKHGQQQAFSCTVYKHRTTHLTNISSCEPHTPPVKEVLLLPPLHKGAHSRAGNWPKGTRLEGGQAGFKLKPVWLQSELVGALLHSCQQVWFLTVCLLHGHLPVMYTKNSSHHSSPM